MIFFNEKRAVFTWRQFQRSAEDWQRAASHGGPTVTWSSRSAKPLSLFFKLVKCGCFTRVFNQAAQKITTTTVSQFESQAATIRANQIWNMVTISPEMTMLNNGQKTVFLQNMMMHSELLSFYPATHLLWNFVTLSIWIFWLWRNTIITSLFCVSAHQSNCLNCVVETAEYYVTVHSTSNLLDIRCHNFIILSYWTMVCWIFF